MIEEKASKIINLALEWCIENFGDFNKTRPYIFIDNNAKGMGWFKIYPDDSSVIGINPKKCRTYIEVVDTVIHEYVHFTQFKTFWDLLEYGKYKYKESPHEHDAYGFAHNNRELCYSIIKKHI
jgi:hypothetical protein